MTLTFDLQTPQKNKKKNQQKTKNKTTPPHHQIFYSTWAMKLGRYGRNGTQMENAKYEQLFCEV